jgi:hypothetical protein
MSPIGLRWHSAGRGQSSAHPLHGRSGTCRDQGSVGKLRKAELALKEARILQSAGTRSAEDGHIFHPFSFSLYSLRNEIIFA